jgi:DNA/RNA-binding domain of Phe-tRNA-synthetase-like protein
MITGNISQRLTNGTEKFLPLGQKEIQTVEAGEYSYIDDANDVMCRMEVRQVEKTKVTVDTTMLFTLFKETQIPHTKTSFMQLLNLQD